MGDVLKLQATIGRGVKDKERDYHIGTIWEGIRMANQISIQGAALDIQAK